MWQGTDWGEKLLLDSCLLLLLLLLLLLKPKLLLVCLLLLQLGHLLGSVHLREPSARRIHKSTFK